MTGNDTFEMIYWTASIVILCATIYVIYYGPIKAVKVGRDLTDQQNKALAKTQLFLTLFYYRGTPIHQTFVNGLNQIDVVFNDTPLVISAWHKYYEALHHTDLVDKDGVWSNLRTELLSQMAISLGYGALSQVDIIKHYYPEGHDYQSRTAWDRQLTMDEFYRNANEVYKRMLDTTISQQPNPPITDNIDDKNDIIPPKVS